MPVRRQIHQRGPKGAGRIRQLQSGRWQLEVQLQGRPKSYATVETELEALGCQARWIVTGLLPWDDPDLVALAVSPLTEAAKSAHISGEALATLFTAWQDAKTSRAQVVETSSGRKRSVIRKVELVAGKAPSHRRGGAASSRKNQTSIWNKWWEPFIGKTFPIDIDEEDLEEVMDRVEAACAPLTVATHLSMIKSFLNWLVAQDRIPENPIAHWVNTADCGRDRKKPIVVPDFHFIDILSDVFGADRLIFELLLGTAGRRSEVAGMRVGEVDFAAKRIWIREPVVLVSGTNIRSPVPKGGKARSVLIGPDLAKLIRAELIRRGNPGPAEPLVTGEHGDVINFGWWSRQRLKPAVEEAIVRWAPDAIERFQAKENCTRDHAEHQVKNESEKLRGLTPHHLRHTQVALMLAAGASEFEIQEILGHDEVGTSRRIYMHILEDDANTTAAKVEEMRRQRAS